MGNVCVTFFELGRFFLKRLAIIDELGPAGVSGFTARLRVVAGPAVTRERVLRLSVESIFTCSSEPATAEAGAASKSPRPVVITVEVATNYGYKNGQTEPIIIYISLGAGNENSRPGAATGRDR